MGQIDPQRFEQDLKELASAPRIIGSDGYYKAADYLEEQLKSIPGLEYRRHEYPVMVPITRSATLSGPGLAQPERVYPFWPAQARVNATPAGGLNGKLVYIKTAKHKDIPPAALKGQIAVVEAGPHAAWTDAFYFGAKAALILGREETTNLDLRGHDLWLPVNLPRFYVPPGALADRLRKGEITETVTLNAEVDWQRVMARNYYALVKPTQPPPQPGLRPAPENWYVREGAIDPKVPPPAALMYCAGFDASGLVPDLAFGAGQAVQAAAGLALLRDAAARPPDRPVMVFFGGADSIQFLGTRNMLMALSDVPMVWREELEELAETQAQAELDLQRLRAMQDEPWKLTVVHDRKLLDRVVQIIETDLSLDQDELFRLRREEAAELTAEQRNRITELEQRHVKLNTVRYAFQQRPEQLAGGPSQTDAERQESMDTGRLYARRTIERLAGDGVHRGLIRDYGARQNQLDQRIALYEWLATAVGRPTNPSDKANNSRLIELMIALDLSDQGLRIGAMYWGRFQEASNISQIQDFRDWFTKQERALSETPQQVPWFGPIAPVLDFEPLTAARAPQTWLATPIPIGTELSQAWGVPGFTMVTLDDPRLLRDTPNDTIDRVRVGRLLPQLQAVGTLFRMAWNDAKFKGQPEFKWNHNTIDGQVVGIAPGRPVPDLPREGFLVGYYYTEDQRKIPKFRWMSWTMGIRRTEIQDTNALGEYKIEGLPKLHDSRQLFAVQVYQVKPGSGEIVSSSDLGKQAADLKVFADIKQTLDPLRNVVFSCEEFTLCGLYDPRFLQTLGEVIPLDARRNADPQRYNVVIHNQLMAGFVEPGARSYLVFRYGRVGNRLLMINMPESGQVKKEGHEIQSDGYTVAELRSLDPLALMTADDFWRLDNMRLAEYRAAGVSSSLIDNLHGASKQKIENAWTAYRDNDGEKTMLYANGAWADNARVYAATDAMARDVVRGAIFLLLLCVPFSFCMERLTIGTPSIYRQIAGAFAIFTVMTAALWSFHPAFKISSSPLIIILAFAIIFMSVVVIYVVYGKFDTELKKIRSGRGSAEGTSFARASVLMSAVLLGIANMRRRKFRTGLTALTVVLITFAVLCFTSATRYVGTTTLPTGVATQYPGLMLRQRGFRPMPEGVLESLRAIPQLAGTTIVERWWNVNAWDPKDQLHLVAADTAGGKPHIFAAQSVLGLSPGESGLSRIAEVIPNYDRLETRPEERIIYLSRTIAEQLKLAQGDTVQLGGIDLEVAGIFEADQFDQKAITLSGEPLAPLKYTPDALDAGGRKLADTAVESLDLDAGASAAEAKSTYEHLSASQFAIVPAMVSRMLPNASLRSVAIKLADVATPGDKADAAVSPASDELSKRFAVAMFAGFSDGVSMVAASNLSSVSGAGQVAIPLAIAGLIIFNTMMGSIAERRREIHVYTSLGLAPVHVGALFVAEAMTYGLLGTVFGYVIGQGVGTALLHLGWLGNVTLNYSGTSAIMTMGLILLIVLLSALVPARLASKIAAPSIERSWKVPLPKGDEIIAQLPFTINKTAADGALAYLAEYFDAHQEGSIGKFSAGKVEFFTFTDTSGRASRGLKTVVWLTPFDLGVRQHLMLLIHPGQYEDIYEVQVVLQRLSGDDASWYRMNRTFLTELRKQFLQWRSLTPQRMMAYVEESKTLFTQIPEQVVTTTVGEEVRLG
jgi:hypothetical protein